MDRSMILHLIQVGYRVYRWWLLVHVMVRVMNVMRTGFHILHTAFQAVVVVAGYSMSAAHLCLVAVTRSDQI